MTRPKIGLISLLLSLFSLPVAATESGWVTSIGGGVLWAPAFPGSQDYQLMVLPGLRVEYGDVFFASVEEGAGYRYLQADGWEAGPLLKLDFGRNADGKNPFRVAGDRSRSLVGFADVDPTLQAGAFVGKRWGAWSARLELLQGLNGHEGFTGSLSADYSLALGTTTEQRRPGLILSTGPRLVWADGNYHDAYFGVSPSAAVGSGLPVYRAGAGLSSVGWGASLVRALSPRLTLVGILGIDRLLPPAADSPLVRLRGSDQQVTAGAFLSWGL